MGKLDKYSDLAKELIKLWNVKVTEIPVKFGVFGIALKGPPRKKTKQKKTGEMENKSYPDNGTVKSNEST